MHGGAKGSGAPKNNKNAFKHGFATREAIRERQELRAFVDEALKALAEIEGNE